MTGGGFEPGDSPLHRALRQTIADGRHEWRRAETLAQRVAVLFVFAAALTRAIVRGSPSEVCIAAVSPLALRWLAMALAAAVIMPSLGQPGPLQRMPSLRDTLLVFLSAAPVTLYLAALCGRRETRISVAGMTLFVGLVMVTASLTALVVIDARLFVSFSRGVFYAPPLGSVIAGYSIACVVLCALILLSLEQARAHPRRTFVSILGFLLPIAVLVIGRELRIFSETSSAAWSVARVPLTAATPLAVMWTVLRSAPKGAQA